MKKIAFSAEYIRNVPELPKVEIKVKNVKLVKKQKIQFTDVEMLLQAPVALVG